MIRALPIRRLQVADYLDALAARDTAAIYAVMPEGTPEASRAHARRQLELAEARVDARAQALSPELRAALDAWLRGD